MKEVSEDRKKLISDALIYICAITIFVLIAVFFQNYSNILSRQNEIENKQIKLVSFLVDNLKNNLENIKEIRQNENSFEILLKNNKIIVYKDKNIYLDNTLALKNIDCLNISEISYADNSQKDIIQIAFKYIIGNIEDSILIGS